ncbi:MAG: hypothetical protein ACE5IJ_04850, partial [Thermoplasmata archaeon]
MDLGFVRVPDEDYVESWRNLVTIDVGEAVRLLSGVLSRQEVEAVLRTLSYEDGKLPGDTPIHLPSRPILRLDRNTVVILRPGYLTRGLPVVYERLSWPVKKFRESKGGTFEELVKVNLKQLPFRSLSFNLRYGGKFEVDAVLEFGKSVWFVEVTSRPPSKESLQGNLGSIERDLEKTVRTCTSQAK